MGKEAASADGIFEEDTQLRDILITGGDALMSQNKTLGNILDAVYRMAVRKRKANQERVEEKSMQSCNVYASAHASPPTCPCASMTGWWRF